ncbi:hypothetical protein JCM3766R1_005148 [Sporobolomyces carnicolor]
MAMNVPDVWSSPEAESLSKAVTPTSRSTSNSVDLFASYALEEIKRLITNYDLGVSPIAEESSEHSLPTAHGHSRLGYRQRFIYDL